MKMKTVNCVICTSTKDVNEETRVCKICEKLGRKKVGKK